MFRHIVFSAALAGLLAGLLWSTLQQIWVIPLILEAETYEAAAPAAPADEHAGHDGEAWVPAEGAERTLYTILGDVVLAVGLGLLLAACYALRGRVDWRRGVLWGLGGFAAFNLAPALGLPPELPGAEAAPLIERQVWWIATVAASGAGLALLALAPAVAWKVLGAALIALPHIVGAPHPGIAGGLAPAELENRFIVASLAINGAAWLVLGALTALFFSWPDHRRVETSLRPPRRA